MSSDSQKFSGSQIRHKFLTYFAERGHKIVHSSSLVPANDPTLLFTNAGMNQFKDVFLGAETREYNRATTSQKCVRAGGKHNDLENVGFTKRHHTFFEMLGNFSFGDYFKKDAVAYAWELVTSPEWFGMAKDKLYVTIFKGEQGVPRDDEAYGFWVAQGVDKDRIFELGMKDNFWAMGDTGPCGPCSEIHYDMGAVASDAGHKDCKFPCDCGRYVEIWNLVFMQFDRNAAGELIPLPKPSIDTGAGLERMASVLQGKLSNYDTDLFVPLMKRAAELCHVDLNQEEQSEDKSRNAASLRVIADHARAVTFLIADGVMPANEGRGYVLRKILRRGIRHGRLLGQDKPFMFQMVKAVRDEMKDAYPELLDQAERVAQVVYTEEERFAHTLDIGLRHFDNVLTNVLRNYITKFLAEYPAEKHQVQDHYVQVNDPEDLDKWNRIDKLFQRFETQESLSQSELFIIAENIRDGFAIPIRFPGIEAFKLYDTFGLPLDFMVDAARDQGIAFDQDGFDRAMNEQRERAKASWKGGTKQTASPVFRELNKTVFEGYKQTESDDCEILAIVHNGQGVQELAPGQQGEIVLDHTPFYADSGGQVGDIGVFYDDAHNVIVAEVNGCTMPVQGVRAHRVIPKLPLRVAMKVDAVVHADVREATMRNHTATHLLHAALRETLGKHVKQAGSLVDPRHLRFDFSHFTAVADEDLQDIEDTVNKEVLRNERVQVIEDVPIDVAVNQYHAMALFGEKYGDKVRVIKIGDFSTELCGGTHTAATGEIGLIKLLREESVSSGVRRLEAITGEGSLRHFRQDHRIVTTAGQILGQAGEGDPDAYKRALLQKEEELKRLRKELEQARMKSASASVSSATDKVHLVDGIKVLAQRVDNLERGQMRTLVDNLRNKLGSGVVVLGSASDGKVALIVGVTPDLTAKLQAGKIIRSVAEKVGGSGGGRADMAEAGGKDAGALDAALASVPGLVKDLLG